jgi:hypothetical protein
MARRHLAYAIILVLVSAAGGARGATSTDGRRQRPDGPEGLCGDFRRLLVKEDLRPPADAGAAAARGIDNFGALQCGRSLTYVHEHVGQDNLGVRAALNGERHICAAAFDAAELLSP